MSPSRIFVCAGFTFVLVAASLALPGHRVFARPEPAPALHVAVADSTIAARDEARADALPRGFTFDAELGRFTTEYRAWGEHRARAHNVELAARYLDGAIVPPGATLSFNEAVGPRTHAAGFAVAPVIADGQLVDGLGGGTCQVAGTLHAAALLSGMDVVEHTVHSRPSTYIDLGLDAAVVWPAVDLKLRNPYAFPLFIEAHASRGQLEIVIRGDARSRDVTISQQVIERTGFGERFVVDPTLAAGTTVVRQQGIAGYTVKVVRTVQERGTRREDVQTVRYPATPRVIAVSAA